MGEGALCDNFLSRLQTNGNRLPRLADLSTSNGRFCVWSFSCPCWVVLAFDISSIPLPTAAAGKGTTASNSDPLLPSPFPLLLQSLFDQSDPVDSCDTEREAGLTVSPSVQAPEMGWSLASAATSIASPVTQPASDPSTNAIVSAMFSLVEARPAKPDRPFVSTSRLDSNELARTDNQAWPADHPVSSTGQKANTAVEMVSSAQPVLGLNTPVAPPAHIWATHWVAPDLEASPSADAPLGASAPRFESVPMTSPGIGPVATEAHTLARLSMDSRIQLKAGKSANKEKSTSPLREITVQSMPATNAPSSVPLLPVALGPPPTNLPTPNLAELPDDPTLPSENSEPCSADDKADAQHLTLALPNRAKRETNPDRPVETMHSGNSTEPVGPAKLFEGTSEKSTMPMKGVASLVSAPAVQVINRHPAEPLAFQGRLVPTALSTSTTKTDHTKTSSRYTRSLDRMIGLSGQASAATDTVPEKVAGTVAASARTIPREQKESAQGGADSPDDRIAPKQKADPLTPAPPDPEPAGTPIDRAPLAVPRSPNPTSLGEASKPAEPPAATHAAEPAAPELPKVTTAKHDIKLEVNSGDQKVEIHLSQKGSDVHVAVRTPDTRLAGELRENLPTLSSRLQQTGLKAEDWHTPTPDGHEWRRETERSAASDSNEPNHQSRSDQQQQQEQKQDAEQRQTKTLEEQSNRKQKGKEFSWFMSSLH